MIKLRLLKLSIQNVKFRKKSTIAISILISAAVFISVSGYALFYSLDQMLNLTLMRSVSGRTVYMNVDAIDTKNANELIEKLIHENKIFDGGEQLFPLFGNVVSDEFNNLINSEKMPNGPSLAFKGYNKALKSFIIAGDTFSANQTHEIILPKYFYPSIDIDYMIGVSHQKIEPIDGEQFLGKTIEIRFKRDAFIETKSIENDTFTYSFKVVGIYDNAKNYSDLNETYVTMKDMKFITSRIGIENQKTQNMYYVVTNHNDTKEDVEKIMENQKFKMQLFEASNYDGLILVTSLTLIICGMISLILVLISGSYLSTNTYKNIILRKSEIGLLKAIGYHHDIIRKIFIVENMLAVLIGVLIGILLHITAIISINIYISDQTTIYMQLMKLKFHTVSIGAISIFFVFLSYSTTHYRIQSTCDDESIQIIRN